MKRIFLTIALVACVVLAGMAQTANRKGFFMEIEGGAALGQMLKYEVIERSSNNYSTPQTIDYKKGGATGGIDLGYRWATSESFAVEVKLGFFTKLSDVKNTHQLQLMPGLRWTSTDFGSMSAYVSLNTGIGVAVRSGNFYIPFELGAGLNLTRKLYAGLYFTEYFAATNSNIARGIDLKPEYDCAANIYLKSYGTLQVKLGYRF